MLINGETLSLWKPIKDMAKKKINEHGVSYGLSEAGYDIRIKQNISFYPMRYHRHGHIIEGPKHQFEGGKKEHGNFALASAIEEFDLPSTLAAVVHDKSTWARQGLSVFNTVLEPGWKGFLTLELAYHGSEPLHIPAGAGIAQVLFHSTSDERLYSGKYQNQADKPVESKFE